MFKRRPVVGISLLTLAASLWFLLLCNASFWGALFRVVEGQGGHGLLVAASSFVVLVLVFNLLLGLLCQPWVTRPFLVFLFFTAAAAAYFMNEYGVMLDRGMVRNVFATDPAEIRDLLNLKLVLYVLALGALPSALALWVRIDYRGSWRGVAARAGWIGGSGLAAFAILFLFYQDYASIFRNHRELRFLLTPTNYLGAVHGLMRDRFAQPRQLLAIGEDARKGVLADRPALTVIVVGETARAANFSLGGYARQTNPRLAAQNIFYYPNTTSCGTDTASSVPCMFSNLTRSEYSDARVSGQEGLLDVLKRAGVTVMWRDNNSGCKGACDRVGYEDFAARRNPELCGTGECYDEILLENLQPIVEGVSRDTVIVLHQKGSHGPAYYLRYPERFARFGPACRTNQLEKCSREEIVNAYDNTILYTDYFVDQVIALLKRSAHHVDASLIYLSDHGESLGENNLYLHGLPRMIAPKEQTHVPFIVWLSEATVRSQHLSRACLESRRNEDYSHDNLFHSVLGLMEVHTRIYRPELDIFQACKPVTEVAKN